MMVGGRLDGTAPNCLRVLAARPYAIAAVYAAEAYEL